MRLFTTLTFIISITISFAQDLSEQLTFGSNPGNLSMFSYTPTNLDTAKTVPLVIVLHGCNQNANAIAKQSGWNELADKYQFLVLYPEQKRVNNASNCFNWFKDEDRSGSEGELESIQQMVELMKKNHKIDNSKVFIHGMSAGAAMAVAYMINLPEQINAGAIFAGGPYQKDIKTGDAVKKMMNPDFKTSEERGLEVASINDSTTVYPRLIVGHGTKDNVVDYRNSKELIKQWCYLKHIDHDSSELKEDFADNEKVYRRSYPDVANEEIVFYTFNDCGHVLPINPGNAYNEGGKTGLFAKDKDFFSTYYVAKDFGLIE